MSPRSSPRDLEREAREFEESLPPEQRKRLGQFFSGVKLGTLLAELANRAPITVLDPMVGHGDLLIAARVMSSGTRHAVRLDGVEVDPATADFARERLTRNKNFESRIITGSAFDAEANSQLIPQGYDLVITNPPFVRYQSQRDSPSKPSSVRKGLAKLADFRIDDGSVAVWKALIEGYSGLADLSIPCCLLAAMLCKPEGHLALVMPAAWRTRDYADVLRYLLLRFFDVQYVVADKQPGWFSDALVRTHLIVAKRRSAKDTGQLVARKNWSKGKWVEVLPSASTENSLVGNSFNTRNPERAFARWLTASHTEISGIEVRSYDSQTEWESLSPMVRSKRWFQSVEDVGNDLPLFSDAPAPSAALAPNSLRAVIPFPPTGSLITPEQTGIVIGQGLRTGCNRFFYVELLRNADDRTAIVKTAEAFDESELVVPMDCLRHSIHRQSDVPGLLAGQLPRTMVMDLGGWVLPEDLSGLGAQALQEHQVRAMPDALADHVRRAARTVLNPAKPDERIPDLSAVRTNARAGHGARVPRFWYQLPALAPRHRPAVFVPRVNNGSPEAFANPDRALVVDANFSSVWSSDTRWGDEALYGLFCSIWVKASMEALGVPMGGGAIKLEATHLRQMALPDLSPRARNELGELGTALRTGNGRAQLQIDALILGAVFPAAAAAEISQAADRLSHEQLRSREGRRRLAS